MNEFIAEVDEKQFFKLKMKYLHFFNRRWMEINVKGCCCYLRK